MAAAEVADAGGDVGSQEAVPVKNTFIHFGAGKRRSLRVCVTDPEDPKLWQVRAPARVPIEPESEEFVGSPAGRPAAIREESAADPEDQDPDVLEAKADTALSEEVLQIQTPENSPRQVSSSPWSASAPTSGLSRVTPVSSPHPLMVSGAVASCSSRTPASSCQTSPPLAPVGDGSQSFKFTLRLADDTGLGIDLAADTNGILRVQGVLPNGAIDAWNRRCLDGSATAAKVVSAGDALVCVNGKSDSQGMLSECRAKLLLSMTFVRKGPEDPSLWAPSLMADSPQVGSPGQIGRDSPKVLQIHAALEGERLHASKSLLMHSPGGQAAT